MKLVLFILLLCSYYVFLYYWYIKPAQKALQKKNGELAIVNRVSLAFHRSLGLPEAIPAMLRELREVIEAEATSLFLYDADKKVFRLRYTEGAMAAESRGIEVPEGEGLVSKAVAERRTLVSHDVKAEAGHFAKADEASGFVTKSLVCVPLVVDGKTVGAFQALNKKNGERFTQDDATLLETLSLVTAIAVRNAVDMKK